MFAMRSYDNIHISAKWVAPLLRLEVREDAALVVDDYRRSFELVVLKQYPLPASRGALHPRQIQHTVEGF